MKKRKRRKNVPNSVNRRGVTFVWLLDLNSTSNSSMWEDITDIIHAAASALKDAAYAKSPMLAVEDFSLFEAMSATELFDEKMDPGTALHCTVRPSYIPIFVYLLLLLLLLSSSSS